MSARTHLLEAGKLGVAVGVLAFLLSRIDLDEVSGALRDVDPGYLSLGIAMFASLCALEILRLQLALFRYPISLRGATHLHFTSLFFANLFPSSLGAEVYKVHLLRQLERDTAGPISLLLLIRLSGLAVLVAMAGAYLASDAVRLVPLLRDVLGQAEIRWAAPLAVGAALLVAAGLLLLLPGGRRLLRRARGQAHHVRGAIAQVAGARLALLLLLGVGVWICRVMALWSFAVALGAQPAVLDVLLVVAFANLVSLLPISFAALGVREGAITLGLAAFGVPPAHALGAALLSRAVQWAFSLVGGILYLGRRRHVREQLLG